MKQLKELSLLNQVIQSKADENDELKETVKALLVEYDRVKNKCPIILLGYIERLKQLV